jgi:hypothetical protein
MPNPISNCKEPLCVVDDRHYSTGREREIIPERDTLEENLSREKEKMRRCCRDGVTVSDNEAIKDLKEWQEEADETSDRDVDCKVAFFLVSKDRGWGRGGRWECDGGEEKKVGD